MTKNKGYLVLTSVIILLPMLAGLLLWNQLPATLVTHFGPSNEPDGFMSKAMVVFMLPLVLLGLHWVCIMAGKYRAYDAAPVLGTLMLWIIPAVSLLSGVVIDGYALTNRLDVGRMGAIFVGVVFVICGNYMPKITRNYMVGIKIPTTLADEDNWNRTHRFAAPVWVAGGLAILLCGLAGATYGVALIGILVAMVALPVAFSLLYAHKKA